MTSSKVSACDVANGATEHSIAHRALDRRARARALVLLASSSPAGVIQLPEPVSDEQVYVTLTGGMSKAIMDCGASESIVGAWTLL